MTTMEIIGLSLALLVMLAGLIGSLVPAFPGPPLVLLAAAVHRLCFGQNSVSTFVLITLAVLALLAVLFDFLAGLLGANKFSATWRGAVGALFGGLAGLFFGMIGILIGPFVGAMLLELLGGREFKKAAKAGLGATLGLFAGIVGKFSIAVVMILLFATNLHHLIIAALHDSYSLFRPGEVPLTGDMAALITRTVAGAFRIGVQLSAPFIVFGLMLNLGLGLLSRLMPQMQVFFVGMPLTIMVGLVIFVLVLGAMMGTYLDGFEAVLRELAPHAGAVR